MCSSGVAPSASVDMHAVSADSDLTGGASVVIDYSKNLEQNLFVTESLSSVKEPYR